MPLVWEPKIITLKVKNFEEVRSFYKAVLSLRVIDDEPGVSVTFDLGNILLLVVREDMGDMPDDFGRSLELIFAVRSLNDILEVLHKLNVEYDVNSDGSSQRLDIRDPEGRIISFLSK